MTSPAVFVVSFVHAHRAFRCVRVEHRADDDSVTPGEHWVVTLEGRIVWSFPAQPFDDQAHVATTVRQWWDSQSVVREG